METVFLVLAVFCVLLVSIATKDWRLKKKKEGNGGVTKRKEEPNELTLEEEYSSVILGFGRIKERLLSCKWEYVTERDIQAQHDMEIEKTNCIYVYKQELVDLEIEIQGMTKEVSGLSGVSIQDELDRRRIRDLIFKKQEAIKDIKEKMKRGYSNGELTQEHFLKLEQERRNSSILERGKVLLINEVQEEMEDRSVRKRIRKVVILGGKTYLVVFECPGENTITGKKVPVKRLRGMPGGMSGMYAETCYIDEMTTTGYRDPVLSFVTSSFAQFTEEELRVAKDFIETGVN